MIRWLETSPTLREKLRIISGFGLVILGIVGIILPVMPGWIFLIPGLVILSEHFVWAQRLLDQAKSYLEKLKQTGKKVD
ncbi:MAG: PGPGW domain-containing protein [Bryobacteraceae bacterium]|nr:PGPGW domain-containing protein [Bryobacteraceae bacterium]